MAVGAFLEPLVVVVLLFGGAWINRATDVTFSNSRSTRWQPEDGLESDEEQGDALMRGPKGRSGSPSLLQDSEEPWRQREIGILGFNKTVVSPNTAQFKNRFLSRVLRKFPFLAECWYWALIYWVRSTFMDLEAMLM